MKKVILISAALLSLVACSKEETGLQSDEIVFTAKGFEASVATKTITPGSTAAVTALSSFNVLAVTGTMGTSEVTAFNAAFTGSGTYKGDKFWPSTNPNYKFYASNVAMTPAASGPTVAASNGTDVVVAKLANPTFKASNALTFDHVFARVGYCKVAAPAGYTITNLTVKVTPKVSGTYNLYSGAWTGVTAGSATTIADALGSTTDVNLYTVPGTYTLTATYDIEKGDWKQTNVSKTADVNLIGGKINNITTTLKEGDASEISVTITLNPWTDNDINVDSWS